MCLFDSFYLIFLYFGVFYSVFSIVLFFAGSSCLSLYNIVFKGAIKIKFTNDMGKTLLLVKGLRRVAFTDLMKKAAAADGGWLVWVAML